MFQAPFRYVGPPWVFLGVGLARGVLARSTAAEGPAFPDRAKEQERTSLYREGVSLAEAGRWDEELKRFERVVAIRSAPPALVALATAQEKTDKLASAKRTFLRAEADARAAGDADLAQKAEKRSRRSMAAFPGSSSCFRLERATLEFRSTGAPRQRTPRASKPIRESTRWSSRFRDGLPFRSASCWPRANEKSLRCRDQHDGRRL